LTDRYSALSRPEWHYAGREADPCLSRASALSAVDEPCAITASDGMKLHVPGANLGVRETLTLDVPAGGRKGEPVTDAALGLPFSGSKR
jgi:hypothetical protein